MHPGRTASITLLLSLGSVLAGCAPGHRIAPGQLADLQPGLMPVEAPDALQATPRTSTEFTHAGRRWLVQYYTTAADEVEDLLMAAFDHTGLRWWGHPEAFERLDDPVLRGVGRTAVQWYLDWYRTNFGPPGE